jgi:hypothetical protein
LERATPSVSEIAFTACPLERARRAQQPFFWLHQIERLAQDLVFEGLLAEQPLQFANLMLQCPVFGGGHHFLAGPNSRQRSLGVEPPPGEHLVWCDPVLPRYQRHRHRRRVEPAPAKAGVSCTIRAFSSADQRRRRCTDVMTSTRSMLPVIGILWFLTKG